MQAVKRVEIVIDAPEMPHLLELLESVGAKDYTIIKEAHGRGDRGLRGGDVFSGVFDNTYLLIACAPDVAERLVEAVRPVLRRRGGICLVSDALWVRH
jgi:nitrogen regulatory protein PII